MTDLRNRATQRRGTTTVELAIILSMFLLFMFAIFEYGRYVMICQLIENAAREGSRQATSGTATLTTADIQGTVTDTLMGQSSALRNLTITVYMANPSTGADITPAGGSWKDAAHGQAIAVSVSGIYDPMLPAWNVFTGSMTMTSTAVMRSEAN